MSDTGRKNPGTMADDSAVGTIAWSNPDNAKASDNVYAIASSFGNANIQDKVVKLTTSSGIVGSNLADIFTYWGVEGYVSNGSSSEKWGLSLTPSDINSTDFGMVLQVQAYNGTQSHYLKATNFGFSIPTNATVDGVLVEIEKYNPSASANVDNICITVYYTGIATPIVGSKYPLPPFRKT